MEAMAEIYERLDLPGYDAAAPTFERYLRSVRNFRKNDFRGNAADIEKVQQSWRPWLERWGYAGPESVGA
jgi:hypothetical protein